MTDPAWETEGGVTVVKLYETDRETERVATIEDAIDRVKAVRSTDTICEKIVTRDDEVVYSSDRHGTIEDWEAQWNLERRALSSSGDVGHRCPYRNAGCVEDELCVKCKMDKQIARFSTTSERDR